MRTCFVKPVLALLLMLGLLGLVGCQSEPAMPANSEPTSREQVVIAFSSEPTTWDPCQGYGATGPVIFSTLVTMTADLQIVGDLAAAYQVSEDALTWTFNLREDARFSDGEPVTAADVVFTFQTTKESATYIDLTMLESCLAADQFTVVMQLNQPTSTFLLTAAQLGIVPQHAYGPRFGVEPVGSGPYRLAQWDQGQQFIFEANPYYYGAAPAIPRAVFTVIPDEDARLLAARSGQVDLALTSATIAAVNEIPDMQLVALSTLDNMGIALPVGPNLGQTTPDGYPIGNDVTADLALRRALCYGVDREQLCRDAFNGYADPAYSECDGMPWWNPQTVLKTDIAYAQALLEEAGWRDLDGDGRREKGDLAASFSLLYFAGDSVRQALALSFAQQAGANLGIEVLVEGVSSADTTARMFAEPLILAWGSANPMTSYLLFHSSNAANTDWYNPENFQNAQVDAHLEAALSARTLEESYPHWQQAQWDGQTGTSMLGEAPWCFLINKQHLYYLREGLDIGRQKPHAHGDAWPLIANLAEWRWHDEP